MFLPVYPLSFVVSVAVSAFSCGVDGQVSAPPSDSKYRYDFSKPDAELVLPGRLREISGLTPINDSLLAAIQDEDGEVFVIHQESGEVVFEFKFAKDGDYEGIELVDDTLYVLRSDGDLFMVSDWRSDERKTDKIETRLATRNDTEGLGYQPEFGRLLVAAKEFPGRGRKGVRSIYGFDVHRKRINPDPAYTLPLDSIGARLDLPGEALRRLLAPIIDLEGFKPAAVAVHPRTGDVFVVSSVLKVIAVLASTGELLELLPLGLEALVQPEGLAFTSDGDLFISTEGAGGKGKIFRFSEGPEAP